MNMNTELVKLSIFDQISQNDLVWEKFYNFNSICLAMFLYAMTYDVFSLVV